MYFDQFKLMIVVVLMNFLLRQNVLATTNETNATQNNNNEVLEKSYSGTEDDYTCRKNNSYVWCIPMDYNNRKEPWRYKVL